MAGIYIHIPFCKKACNYCNFHFSTSLSSKNAFIESLLKEIELRRDFPGKEPIETIYFGGGTPSLLSKAELDCIIDRLKDFFTIVPDAEWTLEANPDDIDAAKIADWKAAGINRLSIGIQSFAEPDLIWMNRAHNARQARESIAIARSSGITNLTIDLIYGVPGLSDETWLNNMNTAIENGVQHLSCYALTVEPKTALDHQIRQHQRADIDSDQQARQFLLMTEHLTKKGFEHYEISNFALPGFRSRHNSSYWQGRKYLGLGPSAHSFDGRQRSWNIANNALYIRQLEEGQFKQETEELTDTMRLNEYIMTATRTIEGIDLNRIVSDFGANTEQELLAKWALLKNPGQLIREENWLRLTREGRLFADGIASDLFF